MDMKILMAGIVLFSIFGCTSTVEEENSNVKKFQSQAEIDAFLEDNNIDYPMYRYGIEKVMMPLSATADEASGGLDYSETNIQVEGVDEADFVKTDGEYIYLINGNMLVIVDSYPAKDAQIVSETEINGRPVDLYVNGDRLFLFSQDVPVNVVDYAQKAIAPEYFRKENTLIATYDIGDRKAPELLQETTIEGNYFSSRMIGDHVYAVVNKYVYENAKPPVIYRNGIIVDDFPDTYYFDIPARSYRFASIVSLSTEGEIENKVYLTGGTSDMYVSKNNIYLVHPTFTDEAEVGPIWSYSGDFTAIHRIAIDEGDIDISASGKVPGHPLNQFSMDEYKGNFRIATTSGRLSRSAQTTTTSNNLYILDEDLETIGKIEDMAKGESIYSARFMGEKAYVVTFQKVDPLFVIDLADPEDPEILGKLKIPGYSDYLHPVNETHIIGLGKEAIPAEEGDFSWYQGVKLSLFDVSDFEKPREVSKYEIGDRGTESYALHDHRAFLFDYEKDLLVIPITLAEIDESQFVDVEPYQYGDFVFQGAYIFSFRDGFDLRGRISHAEEEEFDKSGWYWMSGNSVQRSLFIEDVLYTISNSMIRMNSLDDLHEIGTVELPYEEPEPIYYME